MDANICGGFLNNLKYQDYFIKGNPTQGKLIIHPLLGYGETTFWENPTLDYSTTARICCKTKYYSQTAMQAFLRGHTSNVLHNWRLQDLYRQPSFAY